MSRRLLVGAIATAVAAVVVLSVVGSGGWPDDDSAARTSAGGLASAASPRAPDAKPTDDEGSEVIRQPESSAPAEGLPGLRKAKHTSTDSLVSSPLPETATRRGSVVAGFPLSVIPVLTGSVVRSSGVSSASDVLQVSIVATSSRSPEGVLTFYRTKLSAHGFVESTAPAVGGSTASAFTKGADRLVVTVTRPPGEDTVYSVFGSLHTTDH